MTRADELRARKSFGELVPSPTSGAFYAVNPKAILLAPDERDTLLAVVEAAKGEVEAHRRVITAVTPKHAEWCADDHEEYTARFSAWHSASRDLAAALDRFEKEER